MRKCTINGTPGYFHRWYEKVQIIPPSNMIGGHNGGVTQRLMAVFEYEDGTVGECTPDLVKFIEKPEEISIDIPDGDMSKAYLDFVAAVRNARTLGDIWKNTRKEKTNE